ncbi:MbcA/ParS/Xre antitoxin family protein [Bradyrhizobium sp. SYSU BS000235]|jgi:uncharacterized protein (DUF2384 family)|uniref:MbcA/ParS/Xre antitoxin family protein n=1 Tax=Bradyrhizobium sp. SYSU BS000235 TaxID=3411332 RepID=UPI003C774322
MVHEIQQSVASPETGRITGVEAEAMARAVVRLFNKWRLGDGDAREILGGLSARTYARWKAGNPGRIDRDLATRLSLVMGIHKRLRVIFTSPEQGYDWIGKPNYVFGERSPREIMGQGDMFSLARVRAYLDAEGGGG